jgi:hypothetical protein
MTVEHEPQERRPGTEWRDNEHAGQSIVVVTFDDDRALQRLLHHAPDAPLEVTKRGAQTLSGALHLLLRSRA